MPHFTTEMSLCSPYESLKPFCAQFRFACPLPEDLDGTDALSPHAAFHLSRFPGFRQRKKVLKSKHFAFPTVRSEDVLHLMKNDFSWCGYVREGFASCETP